MEREEILDELRIVLDDSGYDPGWTDPVLIRALSEGQDRFCEKTGMFVVEETLPTQVGVRHYTLSPRVISVLDVFDATGRMLGEFQRGDMYPQAPAGVPYAAMNPIGDARSWQTDVTGRTLTLYPAPSGVQTLTMRLWRRSEFAFSDVDAEPELEIPEEYQYACVEWAAYKLLRHHDMEKENKLKSYEHLAAFNEYVSAGKQSHRRIMGDVYHIGGDPLYVV